MFLVDCCRLLPEGQASGSGKQSQWVREAREASQGSKASKTGGLLPDVRAS